MKREMDILRRKKREMEKKQVKKNYEMLDRWIKIEVMDR